MTSESVMGDDERRAEIEAVQAVVDLIEPNIVSTISVEGVHELAEDIVSALDRLRDARGDDEADYDTLRAHADALAAWVETLCEQVTSTPALMEVGRYRSWVEAARSPQGEDHEERNA